MRKVWGGVMSASGLTGERVMETWRSRSRLSGGESGSCGGGRGCQMPCLWRFVRGVVSMGVVCGVKGTVSGGVSGGVSSSMSSLSSPWSIAHFAQFLNPESFATFSIQDSGSEDAVTCELQSHVTSLRTSNTESQNRELMTKHTRM